MIHSGFELALGCAALQADFFFVPGYAICVLEGLLHLASKAGSGMRAGNLYTLDEVDELYKDMFKPNGRTLKGFH